VGGTEKQEKQTLQSKRRDHGEQEEGNKSKKKAESMNGMPSFKKERRRGPPTASYKRPKTKNTWSKRWKREKFLKMRVQQRPDILKNSSK